jgi:hypothetical protein
MIRQWFGCGRRVCLRRLGFLLNRNGLLGSGAGIDPSRLVAIRALFLNHGGPSSATGLVGSFDNAEPGADRTSGLARSQRVPRVPQQQPNGCRDRASRPAFSTGARAKRRGLCDVEQSSRGELGKPLRVLGHVALHEPVCGLSHCGPQGWS